FVGFAQCGRHQMGVARIEASSGKGNLPPMTDEAVRAPRIEEIESVLPLNEGQQHGRGLSFGAGRRRRTGLRQSELAPHSVEVFSEIRNRVIHLVPQIIVPRWAERKGGTGNLFALMIR